MNKKPVIKFFIFVVAIHLLILPLWYTYDKIKAESIERENFTNFNSLMGQINFLHTSDGKLDIDELKRDHNRIIGYLRDFYVPHGYITEEKVQEIETKFESLLPDFIQKRGVFLSEMKQRDDQKKALIEKERLAWIAKISKRGNWAEFYAIKFYSELTNKQKKAVEKNILELGDPYYMVYMMDWDFRIETSETVYGKTYHFYCDRYTGHTRFIYVTATNGKVDYIGR